MYNSSVAVVRDGCGGLDLALLFIYFRCLPYSDGDMGSIFHRFDNTIKKCVTAIDNKVYNPLKSCLASSSHRSSMPACTHKPCGFFIIRRLCTEVGLAGPVCDSLSPPQT